MQRRIVVVNPDRVNVERTFPINRWNRLGSGMGLSG